jgi:hypothetical protein
VRERNSRSGALLLGSWPAPSPISPLTLPSPPPGERDQIDPLPSPPERERDQIDSLLSPPERERDQIDSLLSPPERERDQIDSLSLWRERGGVRVERGFAHNPD